MYTVQILSVQLHHTASPVPESWQAYIVCALSSWLLSNGQLAVCGCYSTGRYVHACNLTTCFQAELLLAFNFAFISQALQAHAVHLNSTSWYEAAGGAHDDADVGYRERDAREGVCLWCITPSGSATCAPHHVMDGRGACQQTSHVGSVE